MTWKRRPDKSLLYVIGDHEAGAHAQGDIHIEEADLRRLAACWNACDGLTTENLELCGTLDYADVKRNVAQTAYVNDLQTQRDQLLEALKNIVDVGLSTSRIAAARAAIAKATGDKT
jgi:hypothetical protein